MYRSTSPSSRTATSTTSPDATPRRALAGIACAVRPGGARGLELFPAADASWVTPMRRFEPLRRDDVPTLLERAGLRWVAEYGGCDLAPWAPGAATWIVLAERA